jgi:hypothetical protein
VADLPSIRWSIIGSGWISTAFAEDLIVDRLNVQATHIIQAVGCSSLAKGAAFVQKVIPHLPAAVYGS